MFEYDSPEISIVPHKGIDISHHGNVLNIPDNFLSAASNISAQPPTPCSGSHSIGDFHLFDKSIL